MKKIGVASLLLMSFVLGARAVDIKVANHSVVSEPIMTEVLAFCNSQLPFTLAYQTKPDLDCSHAAECMGLLSSEKAPDDLAVIGLIRLPKSEVHQIINTNRMIALINVASLKSEDQKRYTWRLERMIMRSVAFLLGIKPAPDPRCVTRPYQSMDDLDSMGRNYTPPYNDQIKRKAILLDLMSSFSVTDPKHSK